MMVEYKKYNSYTLEETGETPGGGTLTRYFNYASGTVTTLFREKVEMSEKLQEYSSSGKYVGGMAALALTSQMNVQKFSELDSSQEIVLLHEELKKLGGAPPPLEEVLRTMDLSLGKEVKVSRPLQLRNG
jgi:hypothetical protein